MAKSMDGLRFVQENLDPHLQPYAHIVSSTVNAHVGWMIWDRKQLALLVGMDALRRAWEKWQEDSDKFTEKQFFGYAKIRIRGRIFDEYRIEIEARPSVVKDYKSAIEEKEEDERERQDDWEMPLLRKRARAATTAAEQKKQVPTAPVRRERSLNGLLQDVAGDSRLDRFRDDEDLWEDDDESGDALRYDADGEVGYVTGVTVSTTRNVEKLRRLLPEREATMLALISARRSITSISEQWGISRARGCQIEKQAMERLAGYLTRLKDGESFEDLLAESQNAEAISKKKQKKS